MASKRDKARPTLRRILPCPNCGQELEPGGNPFSPCIRCGHTNMRIGPEVPIEPDDEGSPASEQEQGR